MGKDPAAGSGRSRFRQPAITAQLAGERDKIKLMKGVLFWQLDAQFKERSYTRAARAARARCAAERGTEPLGAGAEGARQRTDQHRRVRQADKLAVFPTRSPIDRKAPWLKWLISGIGICLGYGGVRHGNLAVLPFLQAALSERMGHNMRIVYAYGTILLGVLSLILNLLGTANPESRRKLKVIVWGTTVGITPVVAVKAAEDTVHFQTPFWLGFFCVMLLFLFPLSFAYAVVKHRVMEIPVLLKRSARYFVVERGFVILILVLSVGLTLWFGQAFSRHFSAGSKAAIPVGATFGVLLISGATQVHRRVRTRLDRAFFRSSYDAQQILENLAAKTLTVSSREGLAALLHDQIQDALHPSSMYVYLENGTRQYYRVRGQSTGGGNNPVAHGRSDCDASRPQRTPGTVSRRHLRHPIGASASGVPGADSRLKRRRTARRASCSVHGFPKSRIPPGTSDCWPRSPARPGIAMRSIALAEKMAATMEAERRTEQEMQIARQVQSRLLPQQAPSLANAGLRRQVHPDARRRRRLLRLPRSRLGPSRPGAGRHLGQRNVGGAADGQSSGQLAQPIRAGAGRYSSPAAFGESTLLQEHRDQQLRDDLLCGL